MNVLEKILEEVIDELKEEGIITDNERGNRAVEIIRSHMDEVESDDWILCSERLPEMPEGIEDDYCPEFNVTIKGADKATTLKCAPDGTWFDDSGEVYNVIAWKPLPEAYRAADKPDWKENMLNTFLAGH
ncbi:MAG: hypothetical protein UGF43_06525 [Blautia sp.]|uniref:DUF551 domain-containing protein n=1 Tax=Blautia sp. TaxID=1955243 RepID=UPI002E78430E|nr:DUF551 domain-containing protein [Blautia sp.]MEE1443258.1 hypothetical protein [Blautia sp.]